VRVVGTEWRGGVDVVGTEKAGWVLLQYSQRYSSELVSPAGALAHLWCLYSVGASWR
jgi:hypothetical protein